jgi:hypothetical protein
MSPAEPISAPTSPIYSAPIPSPSNPHRPIPTSFHPCALTQKRDPLFSTACALFLIRNFVYPSCFVSVAHSLPKTPGGSIGISNQFLGFSRSILLTPTESVSFRRITVTSIESYSFARIIPKPNGILLFQHDPRGGGTSTALNKILANYRRPPRLPYATNAPYSPYAPYVPYRLLLQLACAKMLHQSPATEIHQL